MSFRDLKQQAKGHWPDLLSRLGLPESYLKKKAGPCPLCDGTDRYTFTNKDETGSWHCRRCGGKDGTGGGGDGFDLVAGMKRVDAAEAIRIVDELLNGPREEAQPVAPIKMVAIEPKPEDHEWRRAQLGKIWMQSQRITDGDRADRYLRSRGIALDRFPEWLRLHPSLEYRTESGEIEQLPALVAWLQGGTDNTFAGLHLVYLSDTHDGKADINNAKRSRTVYPGALSGAVVKLCEPTDTIAIAEGIETALAFHLLTAIPVWAALSDGSLKKVQIPDHIRTVFCCEDVDISGAGQRATTALRDRLRAEGRTVFTATPPEATSGGANFDWLDQLQRTRSHDTRTEYHPNASRLHARR